MRFIAIAAMVWGVVLGAIIGPQVGAAFIAVGFAILALSLVASAAAVRVEVAVTMRGHRVTRPVTQSFDCNAIPLVVATDEDDARLLNLYWNFRNIDDVAAIAERCPKEAQARLIELLLDPAGPVGESDMDRPTTTAERRAVLNAWNSGDSLAIISAHTGRSEWSIGRLLLEQAPQPVGLAV